MTRRMIRDDFDLDVRVLALSDEGSGLGFGRGEGERTQDTCAATCPATCAPTCDARACGGDTGDGCPAPDFLPVASRYC